MAKLLFGKNFMHIKRSTEGTSNEISFSVLDAKKNAPEEPNPHSPRTVSALGKISVFTVPGKQDAQVSAATQMGASRPVLPSTTVVSGAATLGASSEVVSRKARRRARRLLNIAAALLLFGVLIFAGGQFIESTIESKRANENALADAISLLEQTDEATAALDQAAVSAANASAEDLDQLLSSLNGVPSLLDRAANSAERVIVSNESSELGETAAQVKESALARKELLEKGRILLTQSNAAKQATELVQEAWEKTMVADDVARKSAALLEADTAKNLEESTRLTTQASEDFQTALNLVRQAKTAYPRANLSQLENYLELRANAQHNALASNMAISEQDRANAEANSAAYNAAEAEAAALAAQLPANPAQPIVDIYAEVGGATDEAYQQARARVARADAIVREYLG